ncbi:hypothetical protein FRC03_003273 [Tulasnella sp. 419]|nr:hypothetical protein FRC03_003273 [Tulasnella sp. 419]
MDVFGTIVTAVDLIKRIRGTFDLSTQNDADGFTVTQDIENVLHRIQQIALQYSLENSPELQEDLKDFERELETILTLRQRRRKSDGEGWWNRSTTKFKKLYLADDIRTELIQLYRKIQICHQNLQTFSIVRTEDAVSRANAHLLAMRDEQSIISMRTDTIQRDLDDVKSLVLSLSTGQRSDISSIQTQVDARIYQAESNPIRAQDMLGLDGMSESDASDSYQDTIEYLRCGNPISDSEIRYLRLKAKTLSSTFPSLRPANAESVNSATSSNYMQHRSDGSVNSDQERDQNATEGDTIRQTIRILEKLRSRYEIPYAHAALDLDRLAVTLSGLGMLEEATRISMWAVQVHCEIAKSGHIKHLADFAQSLQNHSSWLWATQQFDNAIIALGQSVSICRQHVNNHPQVFLPLLALYLKNLSHFLNKTKSYHEAISSSTESVGIYRYLQVEDPTQSRPQLALALDNHSSCLGSAGRFRDAAMALDECIQIYRELDRNKPADLDELASSLSTMSVYHFKSGYYIRALDSSEMAVEIHHELVVQHENEYLPKLAKTLENLIYVLSGITDHEKSLKVTLEYINVLRRLEHFQPTYYVDKLRKAIESASWHAAGLNLAGTKEKDVSYGSLTIRIHLGFGDELSNYQDYQALFIEYLCILSNALSDIGSHTEAIKVGRDARNRINYLFDRRPFGFRPLLAKVLFDQTRVLYRAGDIIGAEGVARTAFDAYRVLAEHDSMTYDGLLNRALQVHAALDSGYEPEWHWDW